MNRFGQIASSLRSQGCFSGVGSALAVVIFCVPALLFGQVRIQSGQALDANPMLGSGGFNTPVSGYNGLNSQLYITGQVSGLAAFRGTVNYFAPNQINLNLPSDELSRFRQQSVGVSDVLTGTPYATTPYYDRARTTALLPNITAGQTIPGTNVLRSPTMSTPLQPFPSQMAYQPLAPSVPSGAAAAAD